MENQKSLKKGNVVKRGSVLMTVDTMVGNTVNTVWFNEKLEVCRDSFEKSDLTFVRE